MVPARREVKDFLIGRNIAGESLLCLGKSDDGGQVFLDETLSSIEQQHNAR
jgi:hypothetical protein